MKTIRLTMAQALVRWLCAQRTVHRRPGGAAVRRRVRHLRPWQRHLPRRGARGGAGRAADLARPERAVDGAGRRRLRQGEEAAPDHGRHQLDRPGRAQHGDRRRRRARQPPAGPAAVRRHLRQPRARSGAAAGRALQRPDHDASTTPSRRSTRYWDRITRPEQILASLPQAIADDARPGRLRPGLPRRSARTSRARRSTIRSVFFEPTVCTSAAAAARRRAAGRGGGAAAQGREAADHRRRRRALFAGHGRARGLRRDATACRSSRPSPGAPCCPTTIRSNAGPLGVIGSASANALAAEADVVLAVGTRLQDFTTGSWTVFGNPDVRLIALNAARFDATKHRALPVVGDALVGADRALGRRSAPGAGRRPGSSARPGQYAEWNRPGRQHARPDQRRGAVLRPGGRRDQPRPASRPTWRSPRPAACPASCARTGRPSRIGTFDCEFGFSCMGYEIAGGWGAKMADPTRDVIVFVGDGSLPDDELRHLSLGADRPQADRRGLRQRRLRASSTGCRTSRAARPSTT